MIFNWGENGGEAKQHVFVYYFSKQTCSRSWVAFVSTLFGFGLLAIEFHGGPGVCDHLRLCDRVFLTSRGSGRERRCCCCVVWKRASHKMAHDVLLTACSKQAASQVILAVITRFFPLPPVIYFHSPHCGCRRVEKSPPLWSHNVIV